MRIIVTCCFFYWMLVGCYSGVMPLKTENVYPTEESRVVSKENITYYINPVNGSDNNIGTKKEAPWRTFRRVNQLKFTEGDRIKILEAGVFRESLFLIGKGTIEKPIKIEFAPGKYDFYPENFIKRKFQISNANDDPDSPKAIGIYLLDSNHVNINGNGAEFIFRGKSIMTSFDNCRNISVENLTFDYKRPTVSELKVLNVTKRYADIQIHDDSNYKILDSTLIWQGEGWRHRVNDLWQEFNPKTQKLFRKKMSVNAMRFCELETNKVRVFFNKNPGFAEGLIYQNRNTFRDYASVFVQRSENVLWKNINVYFMHGMGFVSQFSDNIIFDSISVKPREGSERTCAAWADILHFSGCKGEIEILNSNLSAANDDAINIHGTYLRVIDSISGKKIKVRFMHSQTYGFYPFIVGDTIEFIRTKSLLPYSKNVISNIVKLNEKEFELVLENSIPSSLDLDDDVIENISWTANVTIRNNKIANIPTRGVLVTTRGKVLIDNNEFYKIYMSGVLIANDANSWFESGRVKDVTICNNKFIDCGSPVINIHPESMEIISEEPVHRNIKILNNKFFLNKQIVLSAKSTGNINFSNNVIVSETQFKIPDLIRINDCLNTKMRDNRLINSIKEF